MKLTVIGGGGVRAPFLARTLIANAKNSGIDEIVFMDINEEKLKIFGGLSKEIARRIDKNIKFSTTSDAKEAIKGARYIITTIRVGEDLGRTKDEEIAQKYGVFGQETTGVGGFVFSLRSIPVLREYLDLAKEIAHKDCIIFNFTNPAGLVTECLKKLGYENVYGICDGPMEFQRQLANMFDDPKDFRCTWYGLNHLSYMRDATYKNKVVQKDLAYDKFVYEHTEMKLMDEGLIHLLQDEFPNEYLYFFYYTSHVMKSLKRANKTRGQLVMEINSQMLEQMKAGDIKNYEEQFAIYHEHLTKRENTYFTLESGEQRVDIKKPKTLEQFINEKDKGGYAAIALNFIKGFTGVEDVTMTLLIQNEGSIQFLEDEQVIEISCNISKGKIQRHKIKDIPVLQEHLIKQIKTFEDLATKAIINQDIATAKKALMVHPLINEYELANKLVEEVLHVYPEYTKGWR